jgi:hypothetical protein
MPEDGVFDDNISKDLVPLPNYGDIMTIEDFQQAVRSKSLVDYDGHGHPVIDGKMNPKITIKPSTLYKTPRGTLHILWFNK